MSTVSTQETKTVFGVSNNKNISNVSGRLFAQPARVKNTPGSSRIRMLRWKNAKSIPARKCATMTGHANPADFFIGNCARPERLRDAGFECARGSGGAERRLASTRKRRRRAAEQWHADKHRTAVGSEDAFV